jgi:hypothetical protein
MRESIGTGVIAILAAGVCFGAAHYALAAEPGDVSARSLSKPYAELQWRRQTPGLPIMISELWGDRDRDGGYGELVQLPPGFDSGLHAHSGDFHGVLIQGTWVHVDDSGKGADVPLAPGSYVRQPGGGMHIDRCVSKVPCVLFLFQYARADVLWPPGKQ